MARKRNGEAGWIESAQRWQIKVTNDYGERKMFVSSKPGKKGKLEAERKADEWLEAGDYTNLRLCDAWERFIEYKKATCGSAWVLQLNSVYRTWIAPELEYKKLERITPAQWKQCIITANTAGRSKKTLANIRGVMTAFFDWCDENRIDVDKPLKINVPKDAPVRQRTILATNDIKTLFTDDTIVMHKKQHKAFYIHAWRFIVLLGLRRGELAGIMAEDIDENGVLHIRRSVTPYGEITGGKTENARREILLPPHALQVIAEQKAMLKSMGILSCKWLFPGPDGDIMDTKALYRHWKLYGKQKGISSTLHELRHTTISIMKTELPEDLLKQMVGHSESMDTGRYKHVAEGDLERTANIVEGVFAKIL